MPVMCSIMVVVIMTLGEMRDEIQLRIKTITITIFWEGIGGEHGTFGFNVGCGGSSWCYC